ncbi:hypothetical protein [Streptomyces tanashiensis]|uniref:hypothetical protein n=1 Tax=Streptomyces tanashiensis TaxID=67367 RepID=UPI0033D08950
MTITVDIRTDRTRHRGLGQVLLAGGVAAGVACLVGPWLAESSGLLFLTGAFEYRWPSFLVAAVLLGAAVRLLTDRQAVRIPVIAVCAVAVVGAVWFRLVLFPVVGAAWEETGRTPAPGGVDRYLVVEEGAAMIDPLWRVSVVDGSGLGAQIWRVAHFDGDTADGALARVTWSGPDALVLTTADGEATTVRLDSRTGKPERQLSRP